MTTLSGTNLGDFDTQSAPNKRFRIRTVFTKIQRFFRRMQVEPRANKREFTRADMVRELTRAHGCNCNGYCVSCKHLIDDVWPA